MYRCAAVLCTESAKNSGYTFFRFPRDVNRATLWAKASHREDLIAKGNLHKRSYRLCGMHFEKKMFANKSCNRLVRNANPSVFPTFEEETCSTSTKENGTSFEFVDVSDDKTFLQSSILTNENYISPEACISPEADDNVADNTLQQTPKKSILRDVLLSSLQKEKILPDTLLSSSPDTLLSSPEKKLPSRCKTTDSQTQTSVKLLSNTPRNQLLKRKLNLMAKDNYNLKSKIRKMELDSNIVETATLEDYKKLTYKFCPEILANFINFQASENQKKPNGRRYTDDFKNYCSTLYSAGPKAYESLKNMLCLPDSTTLKKFNQHKKKLDNC